MERSHYGADTARWTAEGRLWLRELRGTWRSRFVHYTAQRRIGLAEGHRQRAWSTRRAVAHTWFSVAVYEYLGQTCVSGIGTCFFMVEIQGTVDNSRPVGVVHPVVAATTSYYWQQYGLERKR